MSENLVDLYNPQNAKALTKEQLQAMQNLTDEQIDELAKAYPNQPRGNNYLVLINKSLPLDKQVYQLSTWNNLSSLRKLRRTEFVAYSFHSVFNAPTASPVNNTPISQPAKVVDLSKQDLAGAEGLKKADDTGNGTEGGTNDGADNDESTQEDLNSASNDAAAITGEGYDLSDEKVKAAVDEVNDQKAKLRQLVDDKAHHMTIKAQQAKVQEAETALQDLTKK